jgi:hypothetical protein
MKVGETFKSVSIVHFCVLCESTIEFSLCTYGCENDGIEREARSNSSVETWEVSRVDTLIKRQ